MLKIKQDLYNWQIHKILTDIDIDINYGKLKLNSREKIFDFVHSPQTNQTNLLDTLTECIYTNYYCIGFNDVVSSTQFQGTTSAKELTTFRDLLSKANTTEEGFDLGWKIENVDDKNNIYATKGNIKKIISAGEYINEKQGQVAIPQNYTSETQIIRYYRRKEISNENAGFYYVFSQNISDDNQTNNVRTYFNIESKGAPILINLITKCFNENRVPFQFKCLNDPSLYLTRTDTAVLYLGKPIFNFAIVILSRVIESLTPYLKQDVPLFTYPAQINGISFAESPPNPNDSFGLNRSRLIALGIINAINNNLPKDLWFNEVEQKLKQFDINISSIYLNPKSTYPYQFI
jgi:hypothetical protein